MSKAREEAAAAEREAAAERAKTEALQRAGAMRSSGATAGPQEEATAEVIGAAAQLREGAPGALGPSGDQPKDTTVSAVGAQHAPHPLPAVGPFTSSPPRQPMPLATGSEAMSTARPPAAAPTYPMLTEQRVMLTKQHYIGDTLREAGEIIEYYTGPMGSGIQPIGKDGTPIDKAKFGGSPSRMPLGPDVTKMSDDEVLAYLDARKRAA